MSLILLIICLLIWISKPPFQRFQALDGIQLVTHNKTSLKQFSTDITDITDVTQKCSSHDKTRREGWEKKGVECQT